MSIFEKTVQDGTKEKNTEQQQSNASEIINYDLVIIGSGPAGLTAALYAARAGRSVTVFEGNSFGGQITQSPLVENYPGLANVSGMELGDQMYVQAEQAGAALSFSGVETLQKTEHGTFLLATDDGTLEARAVIYAAGAAPRLHARHLRRARRVGEGRGGQEVVEGLLDDRHEVVVVGARQVGAL